jgi:hypothetical protein
MKMQTNKIPCNKIPSKTHPEMSALETFALDELLLTFADQLIAETLGQSRAAIMALRESPEKAACWAGLLARSVREGETLTARAMQRRKARAVTRRQQAKPVFSTQDTGGFGCESARSAPPLSHLKGGAWLDIAGWLTLLLIASVLAGMFAAHHHFSLKGILS